MPFIYAVDPATTIPTHATPNTEKDHLFIKPGTRNVGIQAIYVHGKGAGLTAISGITFRLKKYPSTAAATGTGTALAAGTTLNPRDPGSQAAKASGAFSAASPSGITAGTGTLATLVTIGCGAAGPGGWVAPNADSMHELEGSATQSMDLFDSSGTASLNFASSIEIVE